MSLDDPFESYRRNKSYTYNRRNYYSIHFIISNLFYTDLYGRFVPCFLFLSIICAFSTLLLNFCRLHLMHKSILLT